MCFDFQDLGGRRSYNVDDFFFIGGGGGGGVKNHGGMWLAFSWSCVGVGGCELGFTVIDVSSGSLWRIHGERGSERIVEWRAQERGDETSTVCMCVCVCDLTA